MLNPNSDDALNLLSALKARRESFILQLVADDNERLRGKIHELNFLIRLIETGGK